MSGKLIYLFYRAIQWAASPFIVLYFVLRIAKDLRYVRYFPERLGFLPPSFRQRQTGAIWLHAVSVGEILCIRELLRRIHDQLPLARVFVSTSTIAGRALAKEKLSGLTDGVFYAPVDYCMVVRRILRTLRPTVVVVAETEIWPNLYREAKRFGCGLVVVNGRISGSALPRYRRFSWFFKQVLLLPDRILAQSEANRERYLQLGAPPLRLSDGGNLKYDFEPGRASVPEGISDFLRETAPGEIWIAASTMPPASAGDIDEDDSVIAAFSDLAARRPGLLLILVPRKPERFDIVAAKLEAAGVPFIRRSRLKVDPARFALPGVLLLDSIGELSGLFQIESVVFMGGSLARRGGHNLLEPAHFGRAIVVGPHMENFQEIADEFARGGGCVSLASGSGLREMIDRLLSDTKWRVELGSNARRLAQSKQGAAERAAAVILEVYDSAVPVMRTAFPRFQAAWLLSLIWRAGSAWKHAADKARRQRLATPVVSVGALSMGGAGKTPFVLWLAERLRQGGSHPAILTRGYRRGRAEAQTVLAAGEIAEKERTGDEAQIFLRSGAAPVGIGANRAATGRAMECRFQPDLFVLDDGFQHWRLARDLDIVLIDVLDPLAGGGAFPLGRLREPFESLQRADLIVLTRTESGREYRGIESLVRAVNNRAPILRSRVRPAAWVDAGSGEEFAATAPPFSRVAAFCGLGNPESFWQTLSSIGCTPLVHWDFDDHHSYAADEIRRMAAEAQQAGADTLVTTEKDVMNLCGHAPELATPLRLLWLRIAIELDQEDVLLQRIGALARKPVSR